MSSALPPVAEEPAYRQPALPTAGPQLELPEAMQGSPLHTEYMKRLAAGRDMRVIISADNSATGVGKTTLAVHLCILWDIWSWATAKATLDPREFSVKYDQMRSGSAALLDEAEQAADKRRSMSKDNIAIGHDFATKRYRQIFGVLTLPSKDMMDARIADKLCDFWILVKEPGLAFVFKLDENAFTGKVYYKKVEEYSWPKMDGNAMFQAVEQKKHARMEGKTQSRYILKEEFEDAKKNFWNKATAKRNFELINAMSDVSNDPDSKVSLTQSDIGDIVGMSQSNVSKITNAGKFEDFYRSFSGDAATA